MVAMHLLDYLRGGLGQLRRGNCTGTRSWANEKCTGICDAAQRGALVSIAVRRWEIENVATY